MFTFYIKLFLFYILSAISHHWHIMSFSSAVSTNSEAFFFVLNRRTQRFIARTMHSERRHHIVENSLESSDRVNDQITHVEIQLSLKRSLNDVTTTTNNDVITKRQRVKSRSKLRFAMRRRRSSSSASRLYTSMSSLSTSLSSIRVRRFERLANRSSSFSQSMSSENHENSIDWEKFLKEKLQDLDDDDFVTLSQYEQQSTSITTRRDRSRNNTTRVDDDEFVTLSQLKRYSSLSTSSSSTSRDASQRNLRRDDKKLKNRWMIVKTFHSFIDLYILLSLRQKNNVCSHCKVYQYDEKCRERFEKQKYWHCCSNDKILIDTMSSEDDSKTLEALSKNQKKKVLKNREIDVKRNLQNCMYEIRIDFDEKKHRTKINREFQKLIVNYNNVLFFCSEIVNVNFKHNDWATFRVMRDVKHTLNSVMTNEENRSKFCQIYQID